MSNGSPTAFLTWAILSCLFIVYLLYHLWSYDKFNCIRWNSGRQPGAFKRVMTYAYFLTTPLLVVFSVGITVLKYREGFLLIPTGAPLADRGGADADHPLFLGFSIPRPVDLWRPHNQHMLLAMYFVFSIAWALEQVIHFEELAFWLFLLDQGPKKRDWFASWEYRMWYTCCVGAMLGMPLTTLIARHDLVTTDAWTFLVGSLSSTVTNVAFLYVLFRFPAFLRHVKEEGAHPDVVVRLSTFYEMNLVRVVFRFCATVPLLVLALDGIQGAHKINESLFWSDILLMITAIGQFVSSSLTLMIFFPRSVAQDAGYHHKAPSTLSTATGATRSIIASDYAVSPTDAASPKSPASPAPAAPHALGSPHTPRSVLFLHRAARTRSYGDTLSPATVRSFESALEEEDGDGEGEDGEEGECEDAPEYEMDDVRRFKDAGKARAEAYDEQDEAERALPRLTRRETTPGRTRPRPRSLSGEGAGRWGVERRSSGRSLHPYVTSFTSPIDLADMPEETIPARAV